MSQNRKQNMIEKILAFHSGKDFVLPGEIVTVRPNHIMANDATMRLNVDIIEKKIGAKNLANPEKISIIMDHQVPADSPKTAEVHELSKNFCKKYGVEAFHEADGICHQILVEKYVNPGDLVVGADSHTPSSGSLGAFACGMGSTDICATMITGKTWLKVPETTKVILSGTLHLHVYPKDIILELIRIVSASGFVYKAVEFHGEAIEKFSVSERFTLCNMITEAGGKAAIVKPDQNVVDYIFENRGVKVAIPEWLYADDGANYENVITIDLNKLGPQIACPHSPDNVKPVEVVAGTRIDQAFLGACTNSRIDDLRIAAEVLKGKKVHRDVKLHVAPASRSVYLQAMREGLMEIFMSAGAVINHPGCSTCWGASQGVLSSGQTLISTQNRNFKGRSGSKDAAIYLASPETVAISAIKGVVSDPRS